MAKVAGFGEIGKAAGDLLTKGFDFKNTVTLNSITGDGTKMTVKSVKDGEKLTGNLKLARSISGANVEIGVGSDSKVDVSASIANLYPGLKATLAGSLPDQASGKVTLEYAMPHINTKTVVGLTNNPSINFSASAGSASAIVGTDVTYDTAKSALTKWSIGAAYLSKDYSAGILLADKGDTVKASYSHTIDASQTAGCEVVRKLAAEKTTFTMGYQRKLDNGALLKMRLANDGMGAVAYTFSACPRTNLTLAGQFDTTNLDKNTKLGMSLDASA